MRRVTVVTEQAGVRGHEVRDWAAVLEEAERRGIDLAREFRMRVHLSQGYAEFWQEEEP